jgi:hypothetical protein
MKPCLHLSRYGFTVRRVNTRTCSNHTCSLHYIKLWEAPLLRHLREYSVVKYNTTFLKICKYRVNLQFSRYSDGLRAGVRFPAGESFALLHKV